MRSWGLAKQMLEAAKIEWLFYGPGDLLLSRCARQIKAEKMVRALADLLQFPSSPNAGDNTSWAQWYQWHQAYLMRKLLPWHSLAQSGVHKGALKQQDTSIKLECWCRSFHDSCTTSGEETANRTNTNLHHEWIHIVLSERWMDWLECLSFCGPGFGIINSSRSCKRTPQLHGNMGVSHS